MLEGISSNFVACNSYSHAGVIEPQVIRRVTEKGTILAYRNISVVSMEM